MRLRYFLLFWCAGTLGVLAYAGIDLASNPGLTLESNFSMQPDWSKVTDLQHWGGRLLHHGHWPLLASNAIIIGGLVALMMSVVYQKLRGKKDEIEVDVVFEEDEDIPSTLPSARVPQLEPPPSIPVHVGVDGGPEGG